MSAYATPGLLFPPIILPVASSGSALPRHTGGVECSRKDSEVWLPDKYCCNSRDGHGDCLSAPSSSKSSCAPADVGGDTCSELTASPCSPSPTRRPLSLSAGSERLGHTLPKASPSLSCRSPQAPAKFTLSGIQQVTTMVAERSADLDGYFDPDPCPDPDPDRAVGDWDIQILSAKIDPMRLIGSRTVAARPSAHRSVVLASSQSSNKVESEPSSPSTLPDPDAGFSDQNSDSSNSSTSYSAFVFFGRKDTANHYEARDDDDPYDYSSSDDDDYDSDYQKPALAPSLSSSVSPPPLSASLHSHSVTPHDDAIQFEMDISYNGRSYSATRTLAHFVRLRIDLIKEYARQQFLSGTNGRNNNNDSCGSTSNNYNYNYSGGPRRRTRRIPNSNEQPLHNNKEECHDGISNQVGSIGRTTTNNNNNNNNTIPQLPPLDGGNGSGGIGQGFTMLCALTHSYVPHLEQWIRTVAHIVPPSTSPTLATFLWEPISNNKHKIGMAVEGQNKRESSNWNVNKGMEDSGVSPKKKLSAAGVTGSINGGGGGGVCSRESKKSSCPFYRKGSSNTLDSIEEDVSDEEKEEEEEDKEDKEEVVVQGKD